MLGVLRVLRVLVLVLVLRVQSVLLQPIPRLAVRRRLPLPRMVLVLVLVAVAVPQQHRTAAKAAHIRTWIGVRTETEGTATAMAGHAHPTTDGAAAAAVIVIAVLTAARTAIDGGAGAGAGVLFFGGARGGRWAIDMAVDTSPKIGTELKNMVGMGGTMQEVAAVVGMVTVCLPAMRRMVVEGTVGTVGTVGMAGLVGIDGRMQAAGEAGPEAEAQPEIAGDTRYPPFPRVHLSFFAYAHTRMNEEIVIVLILF